MPARLQRSCAVASCPTPAGSGGRCPEHSTQYRHTVNTEQHHSLYRTARWRRLRMNVLMAEPYCADCAKRLAEEVHHRVHRERDLSLFFERSNLIGLCHECHAVRTRRGE